MISVSKRVPSPRTVFADSLILFSSAAKASAFCFSNDISCSCTKFSSVHTSRKRPTDILDSKHSYNQSGSKHIGCPQQTPTIIIALGGYYAYNDKSGNGAAFCSFCVNSFAAPNNNTMFRRGQNIHSKRSSDIRISLCTLCLQFKPMICVCFQKLVNLSDKFFFRNPNSSEFIFKPYSCFGVLIVPRNLHIVSY